MAEAAFATTLLRTLSSQPITYDDSYCQPPANNLKRIPILPIPVPPIPVVENKGEPSGATEIGLTLKSLKPARTTQARVKSTDTIADLKSQWGEADVRLLLKGKALQDSKLVKEYGLKDGDVVNVMLAKAAPTPITTTTPESLSIDPSPARKGHSRIPSVVLSPSPSLGDEPNRLSPRASPKNILLSLDGEGEIGSSSLDADAYHSAMARPEMWERMLGFLNSEFASTPDVHKAFEEFLRAAKGVLTANEVAKIRDHVGIIGMAGT